MDSAQSYAISAQDFALFVLEFVPPGSSSLCAQALALFLNSSDLPAHDLEDLVSCPPGSEVLCAHFFDSADQVFELFASEFAGSGDNPDCAQSLALSLYPDAPFSDSFAANADCAAASAELYAAVCDKPAADAAPPAVPAAVPAAAAQPAELKVPKPPGVPSLCAHSSLLLAQVFEDLLVASLGSGGDEDCAQSLAIVSIFPKSLTEVFRFATLEDKFETFVFKVPISLEILPNEVLRPDILSCVILLVGIVKVVLTSTSVNFNLLPNKVFPSQVISPIVRNAFPFVVVIFVFLKVNALS